MPIDKTRYASDWQQISLAIREREGWKCKWCQVENGSARIGRKGRTYRVVLTVAHLDHDTSNNDPINLAALCQPCHLRYDSNMHAQHARETRKRKV
jgi:5-methylcytosine-specific restriction endonuclease McrA